MSLYRDSSFTYNCSTRIGMPMVSTNGEKEIPRSLVVNHKTAVIVNEDETVTLHQGTETNDMVAMVRLSEVDLLEIRNFRRKK